MSKRWFSINNEITLQTDFFRDFTSPMIWVKLEKNKDVCYGITEQFQNHLCPEALCSCVTLSKLLKFSDFPFLVGKMGIMKLYLIEVVNIEMCVNIWQVPSKCQTVAPINASLLLTSSMTCNHASSLLLFRYVLYQVNCVPSPFLKKFFFAPQQVPWRLHTAEAMCNHYLFMTMCLPSYAGASWCNEK